MKILILSFLLLVSCSSLPVKENSIAGKYKNACVPEAIIMTEALKKSDIEAKALIMVTPRFSHCVVVYLYPKGQNKLWVYDATWKSLRVRAFYNEPIQISRSWLDKINKKDVSVTSAEFLE